MSVLLEALKKAAEEKNKKAALSENDSSENALSQQSIEPIAKDGTSTVMPSALSTLNLKTNPTSLSSSGLDLDEIVEEPVNTVVSVPLTKQVSGSDELPEFKEASVPTSKLSFSLPTEEFVTSEQLLPRRAAKIEPLDVPIIPDVPEQFADLEKQGTAARATETQTNHSIQLKTSSNHVVTPNLQAPANNGPVDNTSESGKAETNESFGWSLEKLPAYSNDAIEESSEVTDAKNVTTDEKTNNRSKLDKGALANNSVLTKNKHSKPYTAKHFFLKNQKVVVGFVSLTVFTLIGAYSAYYYQVENHRLEASFERYKINPIMVELPKSSPAVISETRVAELDLAPREGIDQGQIPMASVSENPEIRAESQVNESPMVESAQTSLPAKSVAPIAISPSSQQAKPTAKAITEPKVKPLKTNENALVLTTDISTVIQPKRQTINAQISKSRALTAEQLQLADAYQQYQNQEWQAAQELFAKVLAINPSNHKAMLGLAATENYLGQPGKALATYQNVLKIQPGNTYALEAIAEIANATASPSEEWIKQLSDMTEKYPQSAVLQNALGNALAKQNNWFKAQQYYFNAVSLKDTEANFLMNLAVSLDHLGKYQSAEEYYTKALVYAPNSAMLDQNAIKQRLLVLRQFRKNDS
ncbi:hypothetical protein THMIRHAS_19820 [Thiosulfatimonas sediminis]|uniref:Uncharacterized protein n=1 Tax=Thiosulfatimonas sediminis TaxID=2675054 RepID=A0A6F8PWW4_9GAMM|nr:tetratricopeptide repeat protein [Thiosulfatimonas sediminis]BBP46609.1 hypothetical protein THMIRHAS_19820 [Thiosulfatimonas sediminis]